MWKQIIWPKNKVKIFDLNSEEPGHNIQIIKNSLIAKLLQQNTVTAGQATAAKAAEEAALAKDA